MTFDIKFEKNENLIITLFGDLDINTVEKFKNEVLSEYENEDLDIVFDLENLDYLDSTGLGAIMTVYKEVNEKSKSLTIKNAKKNIKKLFLITELDQLFIMEE